MNPFLLSFILLPIHSAINGINMDSLSQIMRVGDECLFIFLNSARSFDEVNKKHRKFMKQYDEYITSLKLPKTQIVKMAMTNTDDDGEIHETERLSTGFGVDMDYAPHIVFVDKRMDKFRYNGSYDVKELKQFIDDAKAQKIPCFYRSEDIPTEQPKGPLKKVVANNFLKEVWESPEQILLYIHKEDCAKCPKFQQKILSKVIERTKTSPNLKFYKIDSSLNQLIGLADIGKEPYVLFFNLPKKELPPLFDQPIVSAEKIITFMKQNSKFGILDPIGQLEENQL